MRAGRMNRLVGPVAVFLVTLVLAACGGGQPSGGARRARSKDPGDSPYCNALMTWGSYDWFKPGGEGFPGEPGKPLADQPGAPEANRAYQQKFVAFAEQARRLAPPEIRSAWRVYFAMGSGPFTAILERYNYDFTNPKLQAVLQDPPAELRPGLEAFEGQIHPYEQRVCGSGEPPPADLKFTGKADSGYCVAANQLNEASQGVIFEGTKPAQVKAFLTSPRYAATLDKLERIAPSQIRADVTAVNAFTRQQQNPLIARFGYDLPRLVATGTSRQRHVLNTASPEVVDHQARINAYEEQVCQSNG